MEYPNLSAIGDFIAKVGFPAAMAILILFLMDKKLGSLTSTLSNLSSLIALHTERLSDSPMSHAKTLDFISYCVDSLRNDLRSDFTEFVRRELSFDVTKGDGEDLKRVLAIIKRELSERFRTIFRKHKHFISRFPAESGDLSIFMMLKSPSDDIESGEAEAHLVAHTTKEPAEVLIVQIISNIKGFGNLDMIVRMEKDDDDKEDEHSNKNVKLQLINKDVFIRLGLNNIDTTCTILKDIMISEARLRSAKL